MIGVQAIRQMIENVAGPLRARLRGVVRRAVLASLDNATGMAAGSFTGSDDDVDDGVEVLNPIGVSSRPPKGTEAVLFAVGGNPANRVALCFVRGQRLTGEDLDEGEVALHIGVAGQVVRLLLDGSVEVRAGEDAGGSVILKANGDVVVTPGPGAKVLLGDEMATKQVALGPMVQARLDALLAAFAAWVPVPADGGAALKTALAAWLAGNNLVSSTNVYGSG